MSEQIRVVALVSIQPGQEAAATAAIEACVEGSRAEAGCHFYTAHFNLEDPLEIVFVERWDSLQALEEHTRTEHYKAFMTAMAPIVAGAPRIIKLKEIAN